MADLTTLEEKLAEVTGLAGAAQETTKKVESLLEDDSGSIADAAGDARRGRGDREPLRRGGRGARRQEDGDPREGAGNEKRGDEMMRTYLGEDSDELDGFEFLIMAEAGEVGHWAILGKLNEKAGEDSRPGAGRLGAADPGAPPEHRPRRLPGAGRGRGPELLRRAVRRTRPGSRRGRGPASPPARSRSPSTTGRPGLDRPILAELRAPRGGRRPSSSTPAGRSTQPDLIEAIGAAGHEVGFHCFATCATPSSARTGCGPRRPRGWRCSTRSGFGRRPGGRRGGWRPRRPAGSPPSTASRSGAGASTATTGAATARERDARGARAPPAASTTAPWS